MMYRTFKRTNERGAAGLGVVIAIAILVAVVYAGIQLIPIYWDHWDFEDKVKENVRFVYTNCSREHEKCLRTQIIEMLDQMGAQYNEKENVLVKIDTSKKKVSAKIWYWRTVKLPFFPNPKQFYVEAENIIL